MTEPLSSKPKLSEALTCPECGWLVGHNLACKYDLRQEIERLRAELEAVTIWYGLENEAARKRGTRAAAETTAATVKCGAADSL